MFEATVWGWLGYPYSLNLANRWPSAHFCTTHSVHKSRPWAKVRLNFSLSGPVTILHEPWPDLEAASQAFLGTMIASHPPSGSPRTERLSDSSVGSMAVAATISWSPRVPLGLLDLIICTVCPGGPGTDRLCRRGVCARVEAVSTQVGFQSRLLLPTQRGTYCIQSAITLL